GRRDYAPPLQHRRHRPHLCLDRIGLRLRRACLSHLPAQMDARRGQRRDREEPMSTNITMPALSPTMEEGNLAKWHVKAGDHIEPGQVIAEIETDKATMEVEAVDEGEIAEILVPEGAQGVKVNTPIATLKSDGSSDARASQQSKPATDANPATQP